MSIKHILPLIFLNTKQRVPLDAQIAQAVLNTICENRIRIVEQMNTAEKFALPILDELIYSLLCDMPSFLNQRVVGYQQLVKMYFYIYCNIF